MNITKKLVYQHIAPTLNHVHPLQVENCDSNSRLVVDEYYNGKLRLERVKASFHISENIFNFPNTWGFRIKVFMELV